MHTLDASTLASLGGWLHRIRGAGRGPLRRSAPLLEAAAPQHATRLAAPGGPMCSVAGTGLLPLGAPAARTAPLALRGADRPPSSARSSARSASGARAGVHPAVKPLLEPLQWLDRQVLVLGTGESAHAMIAWLQRCGAQVRVADTREAPPQAAQLRSAYPELAMRFGTPQEQWLDDVDLIAWSPGLSIEKGPGAQIAAWALERSIPVAGEIEFFAQALAGLRARGYRPAVIAVTGTNGKTTTVGMLEHICRHAGRRCRAAGNVSPAALQALIEELDAAGIGVPQADQPSGADQGSVTDEGPLAESVLRRLPEVWVLELSSFQLALCSSLQPDAATILNLSEDHLDWHRDMASYMASKQRIYAAQTFAVYSRDDPATQPRGRGARRSLRFGLSPPSAPGDLGVSAIQGLNWLVEALAPDEPVGRRKRIEAPAQRMRPLMPADALRARGTHNHVNALAAVALGRAIGIPMAAILHGLRGFLPGAHRCEVVAVIDAVSFIDDSKGTNVGATIAALRGLDMPCHLIAGGLGKGQDFDPLARAILECASSVALIGEAAQAIESALARVWQEAGGVAAGDIAGGIARDVRADIAGGMAGAVSGLGMRIAPAVARFDSLEAAVHWSATLARAGDAVLLSPACASLDMFRDYRHRAQVFRDAVADFGRARSRALASA